MAKPAKAKAANKKPPAKGKRKPATDTDKVLAIIKRSEKGVDPLTLVKKSGFNTKKIQNILYRLTKAGKTKRIGRGIYARSE
ncbi:MAG: hypothetical protein GY786_15900 [Proteobacteria bacterium]|nr:hypothetical protein [Pseudomonadota bacterium]